MDKLSASKILEWRVHQQQIARHDFSKTAALLAWMGALQAQDYAGAKWSVGLRLPEATEADVERAMARKEIVRTWSLRGTLHFIAARDVHWMLKWLAPRVIASHGSTYRKLELEETFFTKGKAVMVRELQGGQQRTREELVGAWQKAGLVVDGLRANCLFYRAALDRVICHGNRRGKEFTFVLLDEWIPSTKGPEGDEALAELARRYFTSHGPATVRDFAWWAGQTMGVAKAGLEMVRAELHGETWEDETHWMSREKMDSSSEAAHFLPSFDEYLFGYKEWDMAIAPSHERMIVNPGNGMVSPVIVMKGRVVGTWKRTLKKDSVLIETTLLIAVNKTEKQAIEKAAERFRTFIIP